MSLGLTCGRRALSLRGDVAGAVKQLLSGMERDYRNPAPRRAHPVHRVRNNGVDTVTIELRSATHAERASAAIRKQDPSLSVATSSAARARRSRSSSGPTTSARAGFRNPAEHHDAPQPCRRAGRRRADRGAEGLNRILVQLPGVQDPNEALRVWARPRRSSSGWSTTRTTRRGGAPQRAPLGSRLNACARAGRMLKREIIASGEQLVDASSGSAKARPAVFVSSTRRGCGRDARDHADAPRPADGRGIIEQKRLTEQQQCQAPFGHRMHRGGGHQRRDHQGVFGSNFQITGLMAGEARELACCSEPVTGRAALYRRAAHGSRASDRTTSTAPRRSSSAGRDVRFPGHLLPLVRRRGKLVLITIW